MTTTLPILSPHMTFPWNTPTAAADTFAGANPLPVDPQPPHMMNNRLPPDILLNPKSVTPYLSTYL